MAGVGRVFQGVEYPSRREACQARHREYVRALADGLNFTQAAHAVGVSKRTGKVWRNGRTRSSGRCERASIAPQAHWYRLYMKCQPHRVSKRFLSLKERMLIFGWRVEGLSIRDIARQLGRSPSTVSRELKRNGITSRACQFFCVWGLEVGGDSVGVGGGELGEGLFPVGGGASLDEACGGCSFVGGFAGVCEALGGSFVFDVADGEP